MLTFFRWVTGVTKVIDRNEPLVREGGRLTGIDSNDSTLFPSPEHRAGTSRNGSNDESSVMSDGAT